MPSVVKIKVERGRDLPPMDHSVATESSTDAYVEVRLENHQQKTNTCRRTLNPVWNEEFHFDFIDDAVMQDEPLELKCFDQDLYSSELIGVTYIDLNPLIMRTTNEHKEKDLVISGWFPLFDTARGMRGALYVTVKLQFIGNENPFQDSSAGIQFFTSSTLSSRCFFVQEYIGFVEELVIQDDQENSWQDYFKGNKTSNDNRLKALYSLSAEARRKLGKKVYECGGNAVLGYVFHLDTEGSSTIVARAYGTACRVFKVDDSTPRVEISRMLLNSLAKVDAEVKRFLRDESRILLVTRDNIEAILPRLSRASTPLSAGSFSSESLVLLKSIDDVIVATQIIGGSTKAIERPNLTREVSRQHKEQHVSMDWMINAATENPSTTAAAVAAGILQSEVHLLTLKKFPSYVQVKLGGLVLARSVKYLGHSDGSGSTLSSDLNTRLEWWKELRDEIKAHAKVLCCHYVIGYSETCTIYGDICILNAIGTAAELKGLSQATTTISTALPSPQTFENAILTTHYSPQRRSLAVSRDTSGTELSEPRTPHLVQNTIDENLANTTRGLMLSAVNNKFPVSTSRENLQTFESLASGSGGVGGIALSGDYISAASSEHNLDLNNTTPNAAQSHHYRGSSGPSSTNGHVFMDTFLSRNAIKKSRKRRACAATHVPYNHNTAPFAFMRLVPCLVCKRKWVPETILTTIELPSGISVKGRGRLLEAKVVRPRKAANGEADAVKVSEVLPFVEYDLQRQIILKLKVLGLNAVFGYNCQIEIGNDVVVATAICTAVYLNSLPAPSPLQILLRNNNSTNSHNANLRHHQIEQEDRLMRIQKQIEELNQYYLKTLQTQYLESMGVTGNGNNFIDLLYRRRSGSKPVVLDSMLSSSPNAAALAITTEGIGAIDKDDIASVDSTRSTRSSSSSSSSTDSSSSESLNDGDDSTSLASPSSSSSSSSSETEEDDDGPLNPDDAVEVTEQVNFEPYSKVSSRGRSQSASSRKSDLLETIEVLDSSKKARPKSTKTTTTATTWRDEKGTTFEPSGRFQKKKKDKKIFKDDRTPFILEIDDETDADLLSVLQDWIAPNGIEMVNIGKIPNKIDSLSGIGRLVTVLRRGRLFEQRQTGGAGAIRTAISSASLNTILNRLFQEAYLKLCFTVKNMIPCQILNITHNLNVLEDGQVEIVISAMVHKSVPKTFRSVNRRAVSFQESDCSDSQDASWKGNAWTPTRADPPGEIRITGASPKINSRSQSFDILSAPVTGRTRGVSVSSNESFPLTPGDTSSLAETIRTIDDESSAAHFQALISKSSESNRTGRLETIVEQPTTEESLHVNTQVVPKERPRNTSAASIPRPRQESYAGSDYGNLIPPMIKIIPNFNDSQKLSSHKKTTTNLNHILLTPLSDVPGARIKRYLGPVQLHFIKDFWAMRGEGTLGSFFYLLLSEINSAARTHVAALGGNALLCHRLVPQEAGGKVARSQGYTMFSISGDAVLLEFHNAFDGGNENISNDLNNDITPVN